MAQVLSPGALPREMPQGPPPPAEWKENLNVRLMCKDCREDPPNLYEDHASGDLICDSCGLVLGQRTIDMSSEWRTFSNDDQGNDDPSRVGDGPNTLLRGDQLETSISYDGGMKNKDLLRAQKNSTLDKGNKALMQAYKEIGSFAEAWQLTPTVVDSAKHIFKEADESKAFKGKSQDAVIAGCVFLACRRNKVPRSFREVTDLTSVSKKEIGRVFKLLEAHFIKKDKEDGTSTLSGGVVVANDKYKGTQTANPSELCARYCNKLNMDKRAENVAKELADNMTQSGALAGRSPLSSAAACIYMASMLMGDPRTPKEIMAVAKVSDSTIRHAYKLLHQARNLVITDDILKRGADPEKLVNPN